MSVQPQDAPYRPAYVRDAAGLYYRVGGGGPGGGSGGLDQTAADARYVNMTGDTMTGALVLVDGSAVRSTTSPAALIMDGSTYSGTYYRVAGVNRYFVGADNTSWKIGLFDDPGTTEQTAKSLFLNRTTGDLTVGGKITVGTAPVNPLDVATKGYVDTAAPAETDGTGSTGYGLSTLAANTGTINTAFGRNVLKANTSGVQNTGVGGNSLVGTTTGSRNSSTGYFAGVQITTGSENTAMGSGSLYTPKADAARATTTQSNHTAYGTNSGAFAAGTGNNIVAIGHSAVAHTDSVALGATAEAQGVNSVAIGKGATATADNTIMLGSATQRVFVNSDPASNLEVSNKQYTDAAAVHNALTTAHSVMLASAAPQILNNLTGAVGTGTKFARDDHRHQILVGAPVALGSSLADGTSTAMARADHVHVYPTLGQLGAEASGAGATAVSTHDALATAHSALRGTATPIVTDTTAAAVGTANKFAREDHRHTATAAGVGALPIGGGTLTGALTGTTATFAGITNTSQYLTGNTNAGLEAAARFQSAGSTRWTMGKTPAAESGANAGSDFSVARWSDAGAWIDNPITITRVDGVATFAKPIWLTDPVPVNAKHVASKQYTDQQDALRVAKTGDSMSGDLDLSAAASGTARTIRFTTGALSRWRISKSSNPESGGSGSNLDFDRYDDAGNWQSTPLSLNRGSGQVMMDSSPTVTGPAGSGRSLLFQSSYVTRWSVGKNNVGESGSNAGSNFTIGRYNDAGTWVADSLAINRATGAITLEAGLLAADIGANTVQAYMAPTAVADLTRKDYVDARTPKIVVSTTAPTDLTAIWVDTN